MGTMRLKPTSPAKLVLDQLKTMLAKDLFVRRVRRPNCAVQLGSRRTWAMLVLAFSLFCLPLFADDNLLDGNTPQQVDESSSPTTVAADKPSDGEQQTGKTNSHGSTAARWRDP